MKKIILFIMLLFIPFLINAKELKIEWVKSFGTEEEDEFMNAIATNDDEIVVVGYTHTSIGGDGNVTTYDKPLVYRFDKNGNLINQVLFNENVDGKLHHIKETNDGGYIAYGTFRTELDGSKNNGNIDATIIKYDENDNMIWEKNIGGDKLDSITAIDIAPNGEILLSIGSTSSSIEGFENKGEMDSIILKLDSNGNILWKKSFGGNDYDSHIKIKILENGDIVTIGYYYSTDIDEMLLSGTSDSFIIKYDKDGNVLWKRTLNGNKNDVFLDFIETQNKEYVVVGRSDSTDITGTENVNSQDGLIAKYNSSGEPIWIKIEGTNFSDTYHNIKVDENGEFLVSGSTMESLFAYKKTYIKYDKNGNQVWSKLHESNGITSENNALYPENSLIIVTSISTDASDELKNHGENDGLLVHYNENGEIESQVMYGGSGNEYFNELIITNENEMIVLGTTTSTDIDGIINKGKEDAIILKLVYEYDIEIKCDNSNGTPTVKQNRSRGVITPNPNEGYKVEKVIIKDKEGNVLDVEVTEQEDGTLTFPLYTDVSVEVIYALAIDNPKTGILDVMTILIIGFLISITGIFIVKNYNERLEF